jgi:hypothetical protein
MKQEMAFLVSVWRFKIPGTLDSPLNMDLSFVPREIESTDFFLQIEYRENLDSEHFAFFFLILLGLFK